MTKILIDLETLENLRRDLLRAYGSITIADVLRRLDVVDNTLLPELLRAQRDAKLIVNASLTAAEAEAAPREDKYILVYMADVLFSPLKQVKPAKEYATGELMTFDLRTVSELVDSGEFGLDAKAVSLFTGDPVDLTESKIP